MIIGGKEYEVISITDKDGDLIVHMDDKTIIYAGGYDVQVLDAQGYKKTWYKIKDNVSEI